MSTFFLSLGAAAPVELSLLAVGLVKHGEPPGPSYGNGAITDDRSEGDLLEVRTEGRTMTISSRAGAFAIDSDGAVTEYPWFLALNPPFGPRLRSNRIRIGIAGGTDDRRLKMSWRTLAELRRRTVPMTAIAVGDCTISPIAEEQPHELHHGLAPAEYLAILDRLDVVLECTDSFAPESFLAVAARDRGVPVVAHADRPDLAGERSRATMWSADSFVEALLASPRERVEPRDANGALSAILELIDKR